MKNIFRWIVIFTILLFFSPKCQQGKVIPKHIFFIVIDTLRADHLGCYGYKTHTSPTIDRLAREGVQFTNAYSTASNTLESVLSFFNATTSLTNKIYKLSPNEARPLSVDSLQSHLKQAGYNTLAVVSNPWLKYHQDYFRDGFAHFEFVISDSWVQEGILNSTEVVTKTVLDFLKTKFDPDKRNFFYIHYLDPHDPYRPPVDYEFFSGEPPAYPLFIHHLSGEEKVKQQLKNDPNYSALPTLEIVSQHDLNYLIAQYDGEIRYVDYYLEKIIHQLRSMQILDDSLIIITADHGEEFGEHGCFKHGFQLYNETIHIPLIFYWHNQLEPQLRETIVSSIDIAPTVLDFCQIKIPPTMLGKNIFRNDSEEPILFCTHFVNQNQRGMRMGKWKLINNLATGEIKLFDMASDPDERNNLFDSALGQREPLLQSYRNLLSRHGAKIDDRIERRLDIDPETREQLKSLGYF